MPEFEVHLPTLRTTAASLADDAADVTDAGTKASGAAGDAGAACDGGALATALRGFATEMTSRAASASRTTTTAGQHLTTSANRYAGDDSSAHDGLEKTVQGVDAPAPAGSRWVAAR